MIDRDQILRAQRTQQRQLPVRRTSHLPILRDPTPKREHPQDFFSTLLEAHWEDGHDEAIDGRPRRRYYRLTNDGAKWARATLFEHGIAGAGAIP